MLDNKLA